MSDGRFVWLTAEQYDAILVLAAVSEGHPLVEIAKSVLDAWDEAPDDATEAAHAAIRELLSVGATGAPQRLVVAAVLRALGGPEAPS